MKIYHAASITVLKYCTQVSYFEAIIAAMVLLFGRLFHCNNKQKTVFKASNFFWRDDWVSRLIWDWLYPTGYQLRIMPADNIKNCWKLSIAYCY